jgi:hypothetical protein
MFRTVRLRGTLRALVHAPLVFLLGFVQMLAHLLQQGGKPLIQRIARNPAPFTLGLCDARVDAILEVHLAYAQPLQPCLDSRIFKSLKSLHDISPYSSLTSSSRMQCRVARSFDKRRATKSLFARRRQCRRPVSLLLFRAATVQIRT